MHPEMELIQKCLAAVRERTDFVPRVGLILGSGLGNLADHARDAVRVPFGEIPHMRHSTALGHKGQFVAATLSGRQVLMMQGRLHTYEGWTPEEASYPVRVARLLGCTRMIVTNASGGVNPSFRIGDIMIITDHINHMPENPLRGENIPQGPRFPDMGHAYDPDLVDLADAIAAEKGLKVRHGVYVATQGPCYETPAEYRMFAQLGADAVGMSTVPEVIVARHVGIRCFGFSIITDLGGHGQVMKVTHEDVQKAANEAQPRVAAIMREMIERS